MFPNQIRKLTIVFLLLTFMNCSSSLAETKPILTDKDQHYSTISIVPWKIKAFISACSLFHHFGALLPYSETWEFESNYEVPLFAKDGHYIVTVKIGDSSVKSQREYYQTLIENMKRSGQYVVKDVEYFNAAEERLCLRYLAKPTVIPDKFSDKNPWSLNYWVAIPYVSKWYALHLSEWDDDTNKMPCEEKKIHFLLEAFDPTFGRKKRN